jgi:hypothetical protein
MRRSTLLIIVLVIVVVAVAGTLLLGRYLTPATQQRIIERQNAQVQMLGF